MMVKYYRHIAQIVDGQRYAGRIHIGGVKLDHQLKFVFPIPRLVSMSIPNDVAGWRKLVEIEIHNQRVCVELTDGEYDIFRTLLTSPVIEFFYDPQTREGQKGIKGILARGFPIPGGYKVLVPTGETRECRFDFTPEACKILSSPKFGCVLVPCS